MDVTVRHEPIGSAHVEVDLGAGHTLVIRAAHAKDRYREVKVAWNLPSTATTSRRRLWLLDTKIDLQHTEGINDALTVEEMHALLWAVRNVNAQEGPYAPRDNGERGHGDLSRAANKVERHLGRVINPDRP